MRQLPSFESEESSRVRNRSQPVTVSLRDMHTNQAHTQMCPLASWQEPMVGFSRDKSNFLYLKIRGYNPLLPLAMGLLAVRTLRDICFICGIFVDFRRRFDSRSPGNAYVGFLIRVPPSLRLTKAGVLAVYCSIIHSGRPGSLDDADGRGCKGHACFWGYSSWERKFTLYLSFPLGRFLLGTTDLLPKGIS